MAGKFIIALACLSVISPSSAVVWDALKVTFSSSNPPSEDSFYNLPLTIEEAEEQGWVRPKETISRGILKWRKQLINTYCMRDDPRVCVLYDNEGGNIVGYQLGITTKVNELKDLSVNPADKGFTRATLFGQDMWVYQMFFVPQNMIKAGRQGRLSDDVTGTGLWLTIRGELVEVPRDESQLLDAIPGYVKQNCFMRMGQHYFYNASKTTQPDGYEPFFLLYSDSGELQGLGMVMFGSNVEGLQLPGKRNWFEPLVSPVVSMIAPDVPDWVLNTIDTVGVYSQHIYFVSKPEDIQCPAKAAPPKGAYY